MKKRTSGPGLGTALPSMTLPPCTPPPDGERGAGVSPGQGLRGMDDPGSQQLAWSPSPPHLWDSVQPSETTLGTWAQAASK